MSTSSNMSHHAAEHGGLRVTPYDRIASLLISLLLLIGFFVTLLFVVWLTHRLVFTMVAAEIVLVEEPAGRSHTEGYQRDLEEPGMEELPKLETPQLESMLHAVTNVVSNQIAALDALQTNAHLTGKGENALGDKRTKGPGGDGEANVIPRWERWRIVYSTINIKAYAQQLDYFGIELGAVGGGTPYVDYARNLSKPKPDRRQGKGSEEKRIYFTQREGTVKEFDRQLLRNAGINVDRRVVMQFYPPDVEHRLALLEEQAAEAKSIMTPQQYKKTIFEVVKTRAEYEYRVKEQLSRPAPR